MAFGTSRRFDAVCRRWPHLKDGTSLVGDRWGLLSRPIELLRLCLANGRTSLSDWLLHNPRG